MLKKVFLFCIKLAVTVLLFVLLFRPETFGFRPDLFGGVTPKKMLDEIGKVETHHIIYWLVFAALVKLMGMMAGVLRWRLLLRAQGLDIPFKFLLGSWFIGRTIGIFLPGTVGLDGFRLYDSARYTGEVIRPAAVIVVEKLIGFIALTFLVFLTFPLGFKLLDIKLPVLAVILLFLATFVTCAFLTLLNPRVIQVLAAVVPLPGKLRGKIDELAQALTAYSGSRKSLVMAVLLGLAVHGATCFMYFGTMMAIRAANTSMADILFASPIMIYATVLGPSVGGEGIREVVFGFLLTGTSKVSAITLAHLGWWVGELVPFVIGAIVFVVRKHPERGELTAEMVRLRAVSQGGSGQFYLSPNTIADYRIKIRDILSTSLNAGLIAGLLAGLCEAAWIAMTIHGLPDGHLFWWGALVYGLSGVFVGAGVACLWIFLGLLFNRLWRAPASFAWTFATSLFVYGSILGVWRYKRDVLGGHTPTITSLLLLLAGVLVVAACGGGLTRWMTRRIAFTWKRLTKACAIVFVVVVVISIVPVFLWHNQEATEFVVDAKAKGPDIIFIGIDTLRADYLRPYNPDAEARTPELNDFADDAVVYTAAYAQSSWTKPSFAVLFTGLYPESHTATSKQSALPDELTTLAEVLRAGGYYTKGFSNNPNIVSAFGFGQGYVDYTDLKPSLHFGASPSASRLTAYEVLRKLRLRVRGQGLIRKIFRTKMLVEDFYQPAESVTETGLNWLKTYNESAPLFLFLHYMDPHDPFMAPESPQGGYARAKMEHPDPALAEPMREAYINEIEHLDKYLGRLFDGLKAQKRYQDALIVVVADHGEEFYDHKGWWHGTTLYEEQLDIPLMIKYPEGARKGETDSNMARHVDVAPTIIDVAGLETPEAMQGRSLLNDAEPTRFSYAEVDFEGNVVQSVRTEDAKLIHANEDNPRGLAPVEFYDIATDPGELSNIAGQGDDRQTTLDNLMTGMQAFIKENAAEPELATKAMEEQREDLESLGYLGE